MDWKRLSCLLFLCWGCVQLPEKVVQEKTVEAPVLRPPAIPLMVQTPYLNVWMMGDSCTDDWPKLWNGYVKGMTGLLRIGGKTYRFLGLPDSPLPAMKQEAVRVYPTRTEIDFSRDGVRLKLEFISPMDPRDLRLLALPLIFIRAEVSAATPIDARLYLDITGEWAVGASDRRISWDGRFRIFPTQPRLFRETHDYPDWGEVHWVAMDAPTTAHSGNGANVRQAFADATLPEPDVRRPRPASDEWPVFAYMWDLGMLEQPVTRRVILAHVRREAVNYFGTSCPAYWTRYHDSAESMLQAAAAAYPEILRRTRQIDEEVLARARHAGGEPLAALAALVFRQVFAANELALYKDRPFYFCKEISSGGFIQTVDVMYSMAPALLAFNPALLRYQLEPVMEAVRRGWWQDSFAMHDLGSYPNATGQTYPSDMKVEESANLILLAASLAKHFPEFWRESQPQIRGWAKYLSNAGFSPEKQLSPDDPAGPQTGNANLAVKSLLALAALPELRAEGEARMQRWLAEADAGDHTVMILGDKASWSLKYNFFFDRLLKLDVVPEEVVLRELAWYRSKSGTYGTPLDGRKSQTKADGLLQVAAVAPPADRQAILSALLRFYNETANRVPAADWYEADTGRRSGFQARPVMGAVFAPVLIAEQAR